MPSALAVLRLIISSIFVACWTGSSGGIVLSTSRDAFWALMQLLVLPDCDVATGVLYARTRARFGKLRCCLELSCRASCRLLRHTPRPHQLALGAQPEPTRRQPDGRD